MSFFWIGLPLTLLLEFPFWWVGLVGRPARERVLLWLVGNGFTYPVVCLVLPALIGDRGVYLAVAETFAPLGEMAVVHWLRAPLRGREAAAILAANLFSWLAGSHLPGLGA